ncbi:MAG: hypothetical protein IPN70_03105 [Candidatus Moraniibacteriota bacterium]|nr:MAG: hypothetical protein IPN70_03105 [Candidatus Moranbacteria bacterium]
MYQKILFLLLVFFFSIPFGVQGQEMAETPPQAMANNEDSEIFTIATVNIDSVDVVSKDNKTFDISMALSNEGGFQPQIGYFVRLIHVNEDGSQLLADTKTYTDIFDIGENSRIEKSFSYTVPDTISGTYDLWVFLENKNGLSLSFTSVKQNIALTAQKQILSFDPSKCFITIENLKTEQALLSEDIPKRYNLLQGVDLDPKKESLMLECSIFNPFAESKAVVPRLKTKKRAILGDTISEKDLTDQIFSFSPSETKTVRINIPVPETPQAYQTILSFVEKGSNRQLSSEFDLHYVIQGESGTIQNILFDKNMYEKGNTAVIRFFWSPSADGFPSARGGVGTEITGSPTVEIAIMDENGTACSDKIESSLNTNPQQTLSVPIFKNCNNPTSIVRIKNGEGKILDEQSVMVMSTFNDFTKEMKKESSQEEYQKKLSILILITVVISVGIVLYLFFRKRNSTHRFRRSTMNLFLFLLFLFSILGIGTEKVNAYTQGLRVMGQEGDPLGTFVIYSGSVTLSGNIVTVTGGVVGSACSNASAEGFLSASHTPSGVVWKDLVRRAFFIGEYGFHHGAPFSYTGNIQSFTKFPNKNVVNMYAGLTLIDDLDWMTMLLDNGTYTIAQITADRWSKTCRNGTRWCRSVSILFDVPIPIPPSCLGNKNFPNASLCSNDEINITRDTRYTLGEICTPAKCEYICDSGYTFNAFSNSCTPIPTPHLILCPEALNLIKGSSGSLKAQYWGNYTGTPNCSTPGFTDVTNSSIWSSNNTTIATVNRGTVQALNIGNSIISARYSGLSDSASVTVRNEQYILTVTKAGDGASISTVKANSTECTPSCSLTVNGGDPVSLEAIPKTSNNVIFKGWNSGCSGRTESCTKNVDRTETVIATFGCSDDYTWNSTTNSCEGVRGECAENLPCYEKMPETNPSTILCKKGTPRYLSYSSGKFEWTCSGLGGDILCTTNQCARYKEVTP